MSRFPTMMLVAISLLCGCKQVEQFIESYKRPREVRRLWEDGVRNCEYDKTQQRTREMMQAFLKENNIHGYLACLTIATYIDLSKRRLSEVEKNIAILEELHRNGTIDEEEYFLAPLARSDLLYEKGNYEEAIKILENAKGIVDKFKEEKRDSHYTGILLRLGMIAVRIKGKEKPANTVLTSLEQMMGRFTDKDQEREAMAGYISIAIEAKQDGRVEHGMKMYNEKYAKEKNARLLQLVENKMLEIDYMAYRGRKEEARKIYDENKTAIDKCYPGKTRYYREIQRKIGSEESIPAD
jgi:tetratricopeptide (TPR) repeat protein